MGKVLIYLTVGHGLEWSLIKGLLYSALLSHKLAFSISVCVFFSFLCLLPQSQFFLALSNSDAHLMVYMRRNLGIGL